MRPDFAGMTVTRGNSISPRPGHAVGQILLPLGAAWQIDDHGVSAG